MKRSLRSALACLAIATAAVACHDDGTTPSIRSAYSTAKDRWESSGPTAYTFVAHRACECTLEAAGPVRITVVNGSITHVELVASGAAVDVALWFDVDDLFSLIAQQLDELPDRLHVTYDTTFGYPMSLTYGMIEVDGGAIIEITQLTPTPSGG